AEEFEGPGDRLKAEWYPKGAVRVAEYWWVESEFTRIALLQDGSVVPVKDVPEGVIVIGTRKVEARKIRGAKITGNHILEKWDWMGKYIPLVPCLGREILGRDGRRNLMGMIRPAMDGNLEYDYLRSKEA